MKKYSQLQLERKSLKDIIPLSTPFGLFIDPTNWCNFHCSFCPRNQDDFSTFAGKFCHMSYELFEKIVNDIKQFPERLKVIRLYYLGEPLLNKNFIKMFAYLCKENICDRIEVTTNGSLLTNDKADALLKAARTFVGNIYFRFSIYGIDGGGYKRIVKNAVDPLNIMHNIKYLFDAKQGADNIFLYAKKLATYDDEDETFYKMFKPICDEVNLEMPMNWSGAEEKNLLKEAFSESQLRKVPKKKIPKACSYPFTNLAVNSDGTVVICCVDWSRGTLVGNVNENSLVDIWNGEPLKRIRRLHLDGKRSEISSCKNCMQLPLDERDSLDDVSSKILE